MHRGARRRGSILGVVLLGSQLLNMGLDRIPPVTLGLVVTQALLYLGILSPPWTKDEICISGDSIYFGREWLRLLFSPFEHGDDMHLYYNMVSFLVKGASLEKQFGSPYFGVLIMSFCVLTNIVYVIISVAAWQLFEDFSYMVPCAIGFSGVIFALKVLTTFYNRQDNVRLYGFPVPSKYSVWIELVIIHLLVPRASFTGHLAGILVGIAYTSGIVKKMVDLVYYSAVMAATPLRAAYSPQGSYRYEARATGDGTQGQPFSQMHSDGRNQRSWQQPDSPSFTPSAPPVEEEITATRRTSADLPAEVLRQLRLQRFSRN
ncbi:unnamed protein product [Darwinula stevensoni]|uniref:Peptidase S54 rhomboid domain-containing protein n=1 Tax=Darwinula stevensoni TaxID=69355 RepID=A0A7R9A4Y7_9CRUS|nr:unnamed protein product [Darwinula stevensoni]CAG0894494.1 unnamed protein product [Darwinula stevensoni]